MIGLRVQKIYKSFEGTSALKGVSFEVKRGEIVALLGPSGCGKSTLLNIIAGLEKPDRGDISWDSSSLADIPPHRRGFGLMFQDFALFPHRNVFDNIAFGLQMAGLPKQEIQMRVLEVLELVGLPDFAIRDINTLSGGESQRVALARSLAPHPRLLMLDEPLGALDRNLRERLVDDLKQILQQSQQTALYVTHDQEEAFALANRVVLMNDGTIEQIGTPYAIYEKPASIFVAKFLGLNNFLPGEITHSKDGVILNTPIGDFPCSDHSPGPVTILIRPDKVRLGLREPCQFTARVIEVSFRGSTYRITTRIGNNELKFEISGNTSIPDTGQEICLSFQTDKAIQIFHQ